MSLKKLATDLGAIPLGANYTFAFKLLSQISLLRLYMCAKLSSGNFLLKRAYPGKCETMRVTLATGMHGYFYRNVQRGSELLAQFGCVMNTSVELRFLQEVF